MVVCDLQQRKEKFRRTISSPWFVARNLDRNLANIKRSRSTKRLNLKKQLNQNDIGGSVKRSKSQNSPTSVSSKTEVIGDNREEQEENHLMIQVESGPIRQSFGAVPSFDKIVPFAQHQLTMPKEENYDSNTQKRQAKKQLKLKKIKSETAKVQKKKNPDNYEQKVNFQTWKRCATSYQVLKLSSVMELQTDEDIGSS